MTEPFDELPEPPQLRFLRILVTGLTAVMIGGVVLIITLLVIRLNDRGPVMPETIALPDGVQARAVTMGDDWYAIVTTDDAILIYDRLSGKLRQSVDIAPPE